MEWPRCCRIAAAAELSTPPLIATAMEFAASDDSLALGVGSTRVAVALSNVVRSLNSLLIGLPPALFLAFCISATFLLTFPPPPESPATRNRFRPPPFRVQG